MQRTTILYVNFVTLLTTIAINYSLNSARINGNTVKIISDRYHNMFTPADYAFGIWGIIYLFLVIHFIYSFYLIKSKNQDALIVDKVGLLFAGSCILNCLWVFLWLKNLVGICLAIMILLLYVLTKILTRVYPPGKTTTFKQLFTTTPFSLYAGWVCVALIANVSAFLVKIGWKTQADEFWTIVLIIITGMLNILLSWRYRAIAFGLSGVWGLTAIAINNLKYDFNVSVIGIITATAIISTCFYIGTRKLSSRIAVQQ
jgi:hypothetical protein